MRLTLRSSSNALTLFFLAIVLLGAVVFIIGTLLRREGALQVPNAAEAPAEHLQADVATRIDFVERLAMVGQPWCVQQLNVIRDTDPDASVRDAADAALLVIGARGVEF